MSPKKRLFVLIAVPCKRSSLSIGLCDGPVIQIEKSQHFGQGTTLVWTRCQGRHLHLHKSTYSKQRSGPLQITKCLWPSSDVTTKGQLLLMKAAVIAAENSRYAIFFVIKRLNHPVNFSLLNLIRFKLWTDHLKYTTACLQA